MSLILDGTNGLSDVDGSAATPAIRGSDANTGVFFGADQVGIATNGVERVEFGNSETVFNDGGANVDFRVEGDTDANLLFVDASADNVGIGTSPSVRLHVKAATAAADVFYAVNSNNRGLNLNTTASDNLQISHTNANYNIDYWVSGTGVHTFSTGGSERARIDSSGQLLIGVTSLPSAGSGGAGFRVDSNGRRNLYLSTTSTANNDLINFSNPNGAVGSITTNASATAYNTSSDYRLKEAIAPMTGALAKVTALKPCTYKWKVDGSDGQGFIAHELAEVEPGCVTGEKDAVDAEGNPQYQGIDTSFLVATLTAAIQELKGINDAQAQIITALTARVEALEGAQA
jgi:hypothetical protein